MSWGFGIKRNVTDALFSDYIRILAGWKCQRCFKEPERQRLHNSHFIGRGNKVVRWDKDNAVALCVYCHRKMGENPAEHYEFFQKRLGPEGLERLIIRSKKTFKELGLDEKEIRKELKEEIKKLKNLTLGGR